MGKGMSDTDSVGMSENLLWELCKAPVHLENIVYI